MTKARLIADFFTETGVEGLGAGGVDSAQTLLLIEEAIDSAYVSDRSPSLNIDNFIFTSTEPQTVFTGLDDNNNTLVVDSNNTIVFLNGVNLFNPDDFTTVNGDTCILTKAADSDFQLMIYTLNYGN